MDGVEWGWNRYDESRMVGNPIAHRMTATLAESLRFVIVGNPTNRRIALFQQALSQARCAAADVVPYIDLITRRRRLSDHLSTGTLLRIESPGEDFEVERALLIAGADVAEQEGAPVLSSSACRNLKFDHGRILFPRQWYLGFRESLRSWARELETLDGIRLMTVPADIEVMFDKRLTHQRCVAADIPVPRSLGPVSGYEDLLTRMEEKQIERVFVKLANSSSASGVVALNRPSKNNTAAITSAEIVRTKGQVKLYNSLKLRCYTETSDIADLIDTLCLETVHVEQWLPKHTLDEHGNIDLRVVVIGGKTEQFVVRQSQTPLTNLHLGNRRGDAELLLNRLGDSRCQDVKRTCEETMALFPDSLYAGVDVLLGPELNQPTVLEVNAFGDLLPGVVASGRDTYFSEIIQARRASE